MFLVLILSFFVSGFWLYLKFPQEVMYNPIVTTEIIAVCIHLQNILQVYFVFICLISYPPSLYFIFVILFYCLPGVSKIHVYIYRIFSSSFFPTNGDTCKLFFRWFYTILFVGEITKQQVLLY